MGMTGAALIAFGKGGEADVTPPYWSRNTFGFAGVLNCVCAEMDGLRDRRRVADS